MPANLDGQPNLRLATTITPRFNHLDMTINEHKREIYLSIGRWQTPGHPEQHAFLTIDIDNLVIKNSFFIASGSGTGQISDFCEHSQRLNFTIVRKSNKPVYRYPTRIPTLVYNNTFDKWTMYSFGSTMLDVSRIKGERESLYFAEDRVIFECIEVVDDFDFAEIPVHILTKDYSPENIAYKKFRECILYGDGEIRGDGEKIDFYIEQYRDFSKRIDVLFNNLPFRTTMPQTAIGRTLSLHITERSIKPFSIERVLLKYETLPIDYIKRF